MLPIAIGAVILSAFTLNLSEFPQILRLRIGSLLESAFALFREDATWVYEPFTSALDISYAALLNLFTGISPVVLAVGLLCLLGYFRGLKLALLGLVTFIWVVATGLWEYTVETLAFMLVGVGAAFILGIIVGMIGAIGPRINAAVNIFLDSLQAFPAFAYLVPAVFLFGMGNTAALVVTVIYSLPPLARMTSLGLRTASEDTIEAAISAGANPRQLLFGVKLPLARNSIQAGTNQLIMYAIAMATMAAMVGAAGLGAPVWSGLSRLAFGDALEGGIALVLIAILIDRASDPSGRNTTVFKTRVSGASAQILRSLWGRPWGKGHYYLLTFVAAVLASQLHRGTWQDFSDPPWGVLVNLREPADAFVLWLTLNWGPVLEDVSNFVQTYGLNVLADFFGSIPWYVVVVATVVIGYVLVGRIASLLLGAGVMFIGAFGMWQETVETMAVVSTSIGVVVLIGFPLGILMAMSDPVARVLRPVLDVMQALPVYLLIIPAVMLLGIGEVAAVLATAIAAVPPLIRYTNAALRGADPEVVEAATMFGATPGQILRQVRIPLGLKTIAIGLNQAILMSLVMAVVSAMIGAPGLGSSILTSVLKADLAIGFEAGLAMFLLAVIIDRLFNGATNYLAEARHSAGSPEKE
ncbi:ABC transporter permease [Leucobacter denitrificans]|uniref:ABC transporter permease subunit n=1 Tax=Leucobacter denitrificans TaxID=683042 RepID=A0A7G9S272_9MICO|nr:ABC transporter permease subunit [Leucobacter denitrificans]QNN61947.1 ABC transporter permease subunit [Leucobacter denitrificans]